MNVHLKQVHFLQGHKHTLDVTPSNVHKRIFEMTLIPGHRRRLSAKCWSFRAVLPRQDEIPEQLNIIPVPITTATTSTLAVKQTDNGDLDYSAVDKHGKNASIVVHTQYNAMVETPRSEVLQPLPTEVEIAQTTRQTQEVLEPVFASKTNAVSTTAKRKEKPEFIQYTPANATATSQQGIIKLGLFRWATVMERTIHTPCTKSHY